MYMLMALLPFLNGINIVYPRHQTFMWIVCDYCIFVPITVLAIHLDLNI